MPAPEVGQPLPRADDASSAPEKWSDWILAEGGHLDQFRRVFGPVDKEMIWSALFREIRTTPIASIRPARGGGVNCQVDCLLSLNARSSNVRSIWHFSDANAAPKLATAFPTT